MKRMLVLEIREKIGQKVRLCGWVNARRDHGKVIFIDLRDHSGVVQLVGGKELVNLRPEYVIEVEGRVVKRSQAMINPKIPTGKIEIKCQKVKLLAEAKELVFPINTDGYGYECC